MTAFAIVSRTTDPTQAPHLARQAEALALAGHAVDVFVPKWPELAQELTHPKVHIRSLGQPPLTGMGIAAIFFWLRTCLTLTLAQFQRRYHVVQIMGSTGAFVFTAWIAHLLGAKILLDVTDAGPERLIATRHAQRRSLRVRLAVLMEQLTVDFADHLIASAEPLRVRFLSRGCPPEKINVIYRTPDENLFGQLLTVARHPNVAGRFLLVCRDTPGTLTDFLTALHAVAALRAQIPTILLWISCQDEHRSVLEQQVRDLNLRQHVLVQGPLAEVDVPAFISQADANIVATPQNALTDLLLPPALLEGLGLGVPTITARTQATQYYFDPRSILVFDSADAADLAGRIDWLYNHPDARSKIAQFARELAVQINWSRERHRYVALILALAVADNADMRAPAEAAGITKVARRRGASLRSYASAVGQAAPAAFDPMLEVPAIAKAQTFQNIPLRLSVPSQEWRAGRRLRMRLGAWTLRGTAAVLLFGIPVLAAQVGPTAKLITAIMFALVAFLMVLLPSGEAAIIVALYFVAQRSLFLHFTPEGFIAPVLVYLGTALQLIIFVSFAVRMIVQQRPLLRSGFVIWPATVYIVISVISAFANHLSLRDAGLGIEHTLHNLIFVVLIAEDLPTPQQLRWYVGFVITALCGLATFTILQTGIAFHWLGITLASGSPLLANNLPVAVIVPDADTYAYLLNFGILLALAVVVALNVNPSGFGELSQVSRRTSLLLAGATLWLTFALFLTSSAENWLGLIGGLVALAVILRGRLRPVLLGFAVLLLALSFVAVPPAPGSAPTSVVADFSEMAQGHYLHGAPLNTSLTVIKDHPLLGVGPGRFGGTVAYITHSPVYTHYGIKLSPAVNSINLFWLHIAGETGLLGLATFAWLLYMTERTIWRAYRKGAYRQWHGITAGVFGIVIAMVVATFFGNALEVDALSAPFWALVGIAVALPIANRPLITESLPALRFQADAVSDEDTSEPAPPTESSPVSSSLGGTNR